jgi:hypothetical protein
MRLACLIAAAILFAGCGTTAMPSSSAKPVPPSRILAPDFSKPHEGLALLVVTRDKGMRAKLCAADLFVDGVHVAVLQPEEQVRLYVEEGKHLVGVAAGGSVCIGGQDQTEANVTRARPFLLRISAGYGVGISIEPSAF